MTTDTKLNPSAEDSLLTRGQRGRPLRDYDERRALEESRDTTPPISFLANVSMNLPLEYVKANPDYEFLMLAYSSMGELLEENYRTAVKQFHYVPVMCSEHPSLGHGITLTPFGKTEADDYYKINGHIAVKRPKRIGDMQRAEYAELNERTERGIRNYRAQDQYSNIYSHANQQSYAAAPSAPRPV